jgi:hypothetical protein
LGRFTVEPSRQELGMDELRIELCVGESIRLDDQILTVIDIHGDEITFRIDHADCDLTESFGNHGVALRAPR